MSSLHDNPWRWQTTPLRRPRSGLRRLNNRNNNNTTPRRSSGSSSSRMVEGRTTTITIATVTCLPEDYIGSEILCSLSRRSCCHHHQHHQHHQHQHPQHHHHQHPPRERTTNRVSFLLYRRLHCLLLLPLPSTRIITIKMRKMADIKQNEKKKSEKKKRKRGKKNLCGITGGQK